MALLTPTGVKEINLISNLQIVTYMYIRSYGIFFYGRGDDDGIDVNYYWG